VLDPYTIYNCAVYHLRVDLPSIEQATALYQHGESCKSELLYGELPLNRYKVALPLKFTVNLDP
jgi:hypothetical protein